jgi:hypothetical protein
VDRRVVLLVLALAAAGAAVGLKLYFSPPRVIQRTLRGSVRSFEEGRILGAMQAFSRTYRDEYGLDFEVLAANVKSLMDSCTELRLWLDADEVGVTGEQATVVTRFVLTGTCEGESGSLLGTVVDPAEATLHWRKEMPGWRIVTTTDLHAPGLEDGL